MILNIRVEFLILLLLVLWSMLCFALLYLAFAENTLAGHVNSWSKILGVVEMVI